MARIDRKTYSTLPEKVREGIDRRDLSSVILLKETAKTLEEASRLKELVFERLEQRRCTVSASRVTQRYS